MQCLLTLIPLLYLLSDHTFELNVEDDVAAVMLNDLNKHYIFAFCLVD